MNYQVVSSQRTGSTVLNDYALVYHDRFGFNELFLDKPNPITALFLKDYSTEEKFEFLEYYKSEDVHFTLKIFPHRIIKQGYEQRLFDYLKGYDILTIERNPWDVFLSISYQDQCNWKSPHRHPDVKEFVELNWFEINTSNIKQFCEKWHTDLNFINRLTLHHTFKFKELTEYNLQKFFNNKHTSALKPVGLDYKSLATNYTKAKEIFDYEMYGSRNRDYD